MIYTSAGMNPMKTLSLSMAFLLGVVFAGQMLGRSMASFVDETRSQQCQAGRVVVCD